MPPVASFTGRRQRSSKSMHRRGEVPRHVWGGESQQSAEVRAGRGGGGCSQSMFTTPVPQNSEDSTTTVDSRGPWDGLPNILKNNFDAFRLY